MSSEGATAADPALIGPVHAALRRDLVRTRIVAGDSVSGTRRAALSEQVLRLMGVLHRHHAAEEVLYRLLVRHDPAAAPLLATRDAEHALIAPAVGALEEAARDFRDGGDGGRLLAALTALDSVLLPHLEREEAELVPAAAPALSAEQWRRWHREHPLDVDWLLDGADARARVAVLAAQPAVPRLFRGLRRDYARRCRDLWAGTAAAQVPALTLHNHADWS